MDFFYDKDIATVIEMYMQDSSLPGVLDLAYSGKFRLGELAAMINSLDDHKVGITVGDSNNNHYISNARLPEVIEDRLVGLYEGIRTSYNNIKNE